MKTMYRAHDFKPLIETVEVVAETAHFIKIREPHFMDKDKFIERRISKDGHFDTWAECRASMIANTELSMKALQYQVNQKSSRLGQIRALKEPS